MKLNGPGSSSADIYNILWTDRIYLFILFIKIYLHGVYTVHTERRRCSVIIILFPRNMTELRIWQGLGADAPPPLQAVLEPRICIYVYLIHTVILLY